MTNQEYWKKCAEFHGHECGGLTIGFKAALYAIELLNISFSPDEEIVCISENDACGVDAIQVILGCSAGKGNLLFHMTGKQAFSFYDRKSGRSVRLVLRQVGSELSREARFKLMQAAEPRELFDVKETTIVLPEPARIFNSVVCEACGETAAESCIRLQGGRQLCLDCYKAYSRFNV